MKKQFIFSILMLLYLAAFSQNQTNSNERPSSRDRIAKVKGFETKGLTIGNSANSVSIDSSTVVNGVRKDYKNGAQLNFDSKDEISVDTGAYTPSSINRVSLTSRYDFENEYSGRELTKVYQKFNPKLGQSPASGMRMSNNGIALVDNIGYGGLIPILDTITYSGMVTTLTVQGQFVADAAAFNGISVYRVNIDAGTMSLVGQSANNPAIFTAAGATTVNVPFTSNLTLYPGEYYAVVSYNSSSQTVAPSIVLADDVGTWWSGYVLGGTFKLAFALGSFTTPPATISASATTANAYMRGLTFIKP